MIPIPDRLKQRLKFGDSKTIELKKLHEEIKEEEVRASYLKTGYEVSFFIKGKLSFVTDFRNKKVAESIIIKMLCFEEKNWKFDKVEGRKTTGKEPACKETLKIQSETLF